MFKSTSLALAGLLAVAAGGAFAQAPGAPPPGGGFVSPPDTPQEAADKKVVAGWAGLLSQGMVKEAFTLYVSKSFNDHSDMLGSMMKGQKLTWASVEAFMEKDPNFAPGAKPNPIKVAQVLVADRDMVTQYGSIGVDIFRVKNGKIIEHWDASPPQSAVTIAFTGK